jgi:hypothetical protein
MHEMLFFVTKRKQYNIYSYHIHLQRFYEDPFIWLLILLHQLVL